MRVQFLSTITAIFLLAGCGSGEGSKNEDGLKSEEVTQSVKDTKVKVNKTIVEAGETIDFSLSDTKDIKSIEWRDKNGRLLSIDPKFNRLFINEGEYETILVVTDKNNNVKTDKVIVKVTRHSNSVETTSNQPPIAKAKVQSVDIMDEEFIHLIDDGSYDPDGSIVSYEWRDMDGILLSDTKRLDRMLHYWPEYDFDHDGTTRYVKTLIVTDDKGKTASKSFTIIVRKKPSSNQIPSVDAGANQTIDKAQSVTLNAVASDSDGTIVSYEWKEGGVVKGNSANLTLNNLSVGTHFFTVTVTDDDGAVNSDTVIVVVNDPPVAEDIHMTKEHGIAFDITLLGSDSDGDSLTYEIVSDPVQGGAAVLDGNVVHFQPAAIYDQPESFTYRVYDGRVYSNTATVTIDIVPTIDTNEAPKANDQNITTNEDASVNVILSATDADHDALTFTVLTNPSHGTLSATAPNLIYTPDANYHGSDSFTYKANDGTVDSMPATVNITINSVNDFPTADAGDDQSVVLGATVSLDGSGSSTVDGAITKYIWSFSSKPVGSASVFSDENAQKPTFVPDKVGTYVIRLSVFDDNQDFDAGNDEVIVTVLPAPLESKLLKTGQTKSFDADGMEVNDGSIKDDGYYQAGRDRNFTKDDANKVMIDNISATVWQNDADVGSVTKSWSGSEAINYCEGKVYDGLPMDLPKIADLFYLKNHGAILDDGFAGGSPIKEFWSSNIIIEDTGYAWTMKYIQDLDGWADITEDRYIRCVKKTGNEYKGDFVRDDAKNIVEDREANLIWEDGTGVKSVKYNWLVAIDRCEGLNFAGYDDWRLPNINELYSTGDRSVSSPAIRSQFANVEQDYYWSATTDFEGEWFLAQAVEFKEGNTAGLDKRSFIGDEAYVRCVRDK